jgi:hypothetical protein
MFNSFNNAGVGNHNWFFNNWFFGFNYMDIGITGVTSGAAGQTVAIANKGGMAIPFDVVVTYADGASERIHRTPYVWRDTPRAAEVQVTSAKPIGSVALDTGLWVDFVPADNSWSAPK